MQTLSLSEIEQTSGGDGWTNLGNGLACIGGVGGVIVTDGAISIWIGAATVGTCIAAGAGIMNDYFANSRNLFYDNAFLDSYLAKNETLTY